MQGHRTNPVIQICVLTQSWRKLASVVSSGLWLIMYNHVNRLEFDEQASLRTFS